MTNPQNDVPTGCDNWIRFTVTAGDQTGSVTLELRGSILTLVRNAPGEDERTQVADHAECNDNLTCFLLAADAIGEQVQIMALAGRMAGAQVSVKVEGPIMNDDEPATAAVPAIRPAAPQGWGSVTA